MIDLYIKFKKMSIVEKALAIMCLSYLASYVVLRIL
jgi:hypothetical protein